MKITLLCNGESEVSWYLLSKLRAADGVRVQAIFQSSPEGRSRKSRLAGLYHRMSVRFFNALLGTDQPCHIEAPDSGTTFLAPELNTPAVEEQIRRFRPDVIAISGTKKITDATVKLAPLALNLHHGMCPLYRGVSSAKWAAYERNYNYFFVTVHRATSELDAGEVYGARQLIPRFPEPFWIFRRRLLFEGADELIEILTKSAKRAAPLMQSDAIAERNLRHRDKPKDFRTAVAKIGRSAEWFRYSAIQGAHTSRAAGALRSAYLKRTRNGLPPGLYIVNYHDICATAEAAAFKAAGIPRIYTTIGNFHEHLGLYRQHFQLVDLPDGIERLRAGACLRDRFLAVTFDDGLKTAGRAAADLQALGVVPTYFVCGDPLLHNKPLANHAQLFQARGINGKGCYYSAQELAALAAQRSITIGSHTKSHRALAGMSHDEQRQEIQDNHRLIEHAIGRIMDMFSFPFGKLDQRDLASHYIAADTARHVLDCNGGINQNGAVPGNLLRIGVHNETKQELSHLLSVQWVR